MRDYQREPDVIRFAIQQSNDIESHHGDPVNGPEDLADSLMAWEYLCDKDDIKNLDQIETMHWLITRRQLPCDERGTLRSSNGIDVTIAGRMGLSHRIVRDAMYQWLHDLPVMSPKEAHIRYEKIHPFVDGNGRSGRLLYYWQLAQIGTFGVQDVIKDDEREQYYAWFK